MSAEGTEGDVNEVNTKVCKRTHAHYKVQEDKESALSALPPIEAHPLDTKDTKVYYGVRVVTGDQEDSGTKNRNAYVILMGAKGNSARIKVKSTSDIFSASTSRSTYVDLLVECDSDLGEILVVEIGNDSATGIFGDAWYVDYVMVQTFDENQKIIQFPCHHWINNDNLVHVTSQTTKVQDVADNPVLMKHRQLQLAERVKAYPWHKDEFGMPSHFKPDAKIPLDQEFERMKDRDWTNDSLKNIVKTGLKQVSTSLPSLEGYLAFAKALGPADMDVFEASRWVSDVEFGRQILNGTNPVVIKKCRSLPSYFPVNHEIVKPFLQRGLTLEKEMEDGHVYICDLTYVMDGLKCREGQFAAAPVCLLYVNVASQLVPIAIQLKKEPGEENPIFVPSDNWIDWLLAKMHYQSCNLQFHQIVTHYFCCHAVMEAYTMATLRNLPDPHPVFKLLNPHFLFTMGTNVRARDTLINRGGIIDQIFSIGGDGKEEMTRRASSIYRVQWTNIKRNIEERGVDDCQQLPGYHYRDDGLLIWNAIESFVRGVIELFYRSDEDVQTDSELQNWALDIHTNGFPEFGDGPTGRGFPSSISTRDELVENCTCIIFTGSAQHASVNFGQYTYYRFVPNAPVTMRKPPPTKKRVNSYQALLDTLPDRKSTALALSIANLLSTYFKNEIILGMYPRERFAEPEVTQLIKKFSSELKEIESKLQERNKEIEVPYIYMLPSRISASVTT